MDALQGARTDASVMPVGGGPGATAAFVPDLRRVVEVPE